MKSAFAKLDHARRRLAELTAVVEKYRASEPITYGYVAVDNPFSDSLTDVVYSARVREPIPDEWPLLTGDVLTNLRAALDHSVYGHADARNELTDKQRKALQFPIIEKLDSWNNSKTGPPVTLAPLLDPKVFAVIEKRQPCHADGQDNPLALLNELVNGDKHRTLRVITYNHRTFRIVETEAEVVAVTSMAGEMTDGAVLARVTCKRPADPGPVARMHSMHARVEFGYAEEMHVPSLQMGLSLLDTLGNLTDGVDIILRELEHVGC
ncbi:hypothetical protein [Nocardia sp. NPDC004711]